TVGTGARSAEREQMTLAVAESAGREQSDLLALPVAGRRFAAAVDWEATSDNRRWEQRARVRRSIAVAAMWQPVASPGRLEFQVAGRSAGSRPAQLQLAGAQSRPGLARTAESHLADSH